MTDNPIFSTYTCAMNSENTKNSTLNIRIPALTFGTLAIQAAQAGIDISTLLTREALTRQGRNMTPAALPPIPTTPSVSPAPAASLIPYAPCPVIVAGEDPDLNLR